MKAMRVQSAECKVQSAKYKHAGATLTVSVQSPSATLHFALPMFFLVLLGANASRASPSQPKRSASPPPRTASCKKSEWNSAKP
ncbi:MAG: hypothetical protein FD138_1762 [Planctomycetota bacterium]|nr:MAG: hypothetical protein FD138_1762 [Planctomycetota bacterium]